MTKVIIFDFKPLPIMERQAPEPEGETLPTRRYSADTLDDASRAFNQSSNASCGSSASLFGSRRDSGSTPCINFILFKLPSSDNFTSMSEILSYLNGLIEIGASPSEYKAGMERDTFSIIGNPRENKDFMDQQPQLPTIQTEAATSRGVYS